MKPAITPQQAYLTDDKSSPLARYKELAVGDSSFFYFAYYELTQLLCSNLCGALGLAARALTYPKLFSTCGHGTPFGRGLVLRGTSKISLGTKCMIDDYAVLDARGKDAAITFGDYVSLGRSSAIVAKNSKITVSNGVNIGTNCRIATQSKIEIGESTLIAAYVYIGPGNHKTGDSEKPLIAQEMDLKGGVTIGKNVWIGARATILDGVTIGDGAIIGAHSLVREDVPAGKTAVGTPARLL